MEEIRNARFIRTPLPTAEKAWRFFRDFSVAKPVKSAVLEVSALGCYVADVNGTEAKTYVLAPGWTSFDTRLQVQTCDVTALLKPGENTLSITAGIGFCFTAEAGFRIPKPGQHETPELPVGNLAVIAALILTYADGTKETVYTDGAWQVEETAWRYTQMYNGDIFDAGYRPDRTYPVTVLPLTTERLIPQQGEIIAEQEHLPVKEVIHTPAGETVLDFGQNLTGYVSFRVKGEKYGVCRLSHGEIIDKHGNFFNENYRSAKAQIAFICDGKEHIYKPRFSFFGFRYVRVDEWSGEFDPRDFEAIVVHSDMKRTGYFSCSDPKINQLYHNIVWGQKGNFLDVPTDCPQRDERMGWTGDAEVFCRCASFNYDTRKFFRKWLADMRADQAEDGIVGRIIPRMWAAQVAAPAWSDACTIIPWQLYLTYGDKSFLSDNLDMMRRFIEYIRRDPDAYFSPDQHGYGDWLALDTKTVRTVGATPKGFIAACYTYLSVTIYLKSCEILGAPHDDYEPFLNRIRSEIYEKYMDEEKFNRESPIADSFSLHTQTRLVLLLALGLYRSEEEKKALAAELDRMVREAGHLTTGFVGTPWLLHVLTENGYADTAYDLLFYEDLPSWLYAVNRGATTIWERWNALDENGDVFGSVMVSFNHYAYGAVGDWLYMKTLGINYDEEKPGFAHIILSPVTNDRLTHAEGSLLTKYGEIKSSWKKERGKTEYAFTVPAGTTATVVLPGIREEVGAGDHRFVI